MDRLPRLLAGAALLALGLALAGCSGDASKFDPTDLLDSVFADQKKPLKGERKPLFPEGTPGVPQGVPPELVKGYQPPPDQPPPDDNPQPTKPKAKAKAKASGTAAAASQPGPTQLAPAN
jgi:hypothetical protein